MAIDINVNVAFPRSSTTTFLIARPGVVFFRVLGWGLWWGTYAQHRAYFSERNGIRKPVVRTKLWRVFVLRPSKRPDSRKRISVGSAILPLDDE